MNGDDGWPAGRQAMVAGRALLQRAAKGFVVVGCDHDVDGLASGVLVARSVERLGGRAEIVPVGRGQHAHMDVYRHELATRAANAYVITDMGSRPEPIGLPAPTLLVDHHDASVFPPDAVVVSASRRLPVAPTSYVAYELLRPLTAIEDLDWLALLGTVADLGPHASFGAVPGWRARHKATHIREAIALLNAARRSPGHDVGTALAVLRQARSAEEIAKGQTPGISVLRNLRAEVASEVNRLSRTAPRVVGDVALIRIRSKAQIHPLIAVRWKTRLANKIVVVANEDFLPGRVSFVVRSARPMDLIEWLRSLSVGNVGPDYARGHPMATGGIVTHDAFERIVRAMNARPSTP